MPVSTEIHLSLGFSWKGYYMIQKQYQKHAYSKYNVTCYRTVFNMFL